MVGAGGGAVLIAAGKESDSSLGVNLGTHQVSGYTTNGSGAGLNGGQYGLYAGAGV